MAKQTINIGTSPNKGDGDPLRTSFTKINQNFDELYALTGGTAAELEELAQDYAATMFDHANHTNITATYDDVNNQVILSTTSHVQNISELNNDVGYITSANTGFTIVANDSTSLEVDGGDVLTIYGEGGTTVNLNPAGGLEISSHDIINDLSDVDILSPATGDFLTYNGTTGKWINAALLNNIVAGSNISLLTNDEGYLTTVTGTVTGSLVPDTDVTYDLGSATNRFRDIYLSGSTIDLGGTTLSVVSGELQLGGVKIPTQAEITSQIATAVSAPTGDLTGSVFADDSTLLVDGVAGKIVGEVDTANGSISNITTTNLYAANSTGVNIVANGFNNLVVKETEVLVQNVALKTNSLTSIDGTLNINGDVDFGNSGTIDFTGATITGIKIGSAGSIEFETENDPNFWSNGSINTEDYSYIFNFPTNQSDTTAPLIVGWNDRPYLKPFLETSIGATEATLGAFKRSISIEGGNATETRVPGNVYLTFGRNVSAATFGDIIIGNAGAGDIYIGKDPANNTSHTGAISIGGDNSSTALRGTVDFTNATVTGLDIQANGDLTGSVFADDSTLLVDGVAGKIVGTVETGTIRTNVIFAKNSTVDIITGSGGTFGGNFGTVSYTDSVMTVGHTTLVQIGNSGDVNIGVNGQTTSFAGTVDFSSATVTGLSGSSYSDTDVATYLNGNLDTSIIPDTNSTYDIGSAEFKIRHFYLSNNSMKFVDDTDPLNPVEYPLGVTNDYRLQFNGQPIKNSSSSDAPIGGAIDITVTNHFIVPGQNYTLADGTYIGQELKFWRNPGSGFNDITVANAVWTDGSLVTAAATNFTWRLEELSTGMYSCIWNGTGWILANGSIGA